MTATPPIGADVPANATPDAGPVAPATRPITYDDLSHLSAYVHSAGPLVVREPHPVPDRGAQRFNNLQSKIERDQHDRDMADRDAYRDQRDHFARCAFFLAASWAGASVALVILSGLPAENHMHLVISDSVLIASMGGAFVSVIGLFGLVLKGLFPGGQG